MKVKPNESLVSLPIGPDSCILTFSLSKHIELNNLFSTVYQRSNVSLCQRVLICTVNGNCAVPGGWLQIHLLMWGGMSGEHWMDSVIINRTLTFQVCFEEILEPDVILFKQSHPDMHLFHPEKACLHLECITREYPADNKSQVPLWTP